MSHITYRPKWPAGIRGQTVRRAKFTILVLRRNRIVKVLALSVYLPNEFYYDGLSLIEQCLNLICKHPKNFFAIWVNFAMQVLETGNFAIANAFCYESLKMPILICGSALLLAILLCGFVVLLYQLSNILLSEHPLYNIFIEKFVGLSLKLFYV